MIVDRANAIPTMLINDIRYQISGFITDTPLEAYEHCYYANALFPVALIQNMLPDMVKNKQGLIANILSAVVYHSFPGVSAYFSAKSALGAIHEALNIELAGTSVKTLYIRPGGYLSNYWKNTEIGSRIQDFKYPPLHDLRDPQYLANRIFKAIEQEKVEVQIGSWKDRLGYHMSYWAPKLLDRIIAGKNRPLIDKQPNR